MSQDPLALDRETMRRLGYLTVDMLVDRLSEAGAVPLRRASPSEMASRLGGPPPAGGEPIEQILRQLGEDVLPFMSRVADRRFLAFVPSCGTWPGALGDFITSACNIYAGSWMESAGPSQVELEVLGWFAEWIGYPRDSAGSLVSGGSAANMTAIACAREALAGPMNDRLVLYVSDQAHSSLARAARVLGFRPDQVRVIPADASYRLQPDRLAAAMDADLAAGRTPLVVSVNAGSTNTGAVDPLPELAALCRERGVWMHADAAYGGFAVLTERGRRQLTGLELADSVTLDPHKWLYQPYECGCLLVREGRTLRSAFEILPDYLRDAEAADAEVNFADLGMQLTRTSRALKCWVSLRYFGLDAFRAAIDRTLDLAWLAANRIARSETLELVTQPSLGILCFRRGFPGSPEVVDDSNARLVAALEASGVALVSSTRLDGRYAIRLCVLNHTTTAEDVEAALDFLETKKLPGGSIPASVDRERDVSGSWVLADEASGDAQVALLPFFHGLAPHELDRVRASTTEVVVEPGDVIVGQWDLSRDFFVLTEGEVDIEVDGERVAHVGQGDFVGELAALDWGAGFGFSRTATVRATERARLLVMTGEELCRIMRELPVVESRIRAAVAQRLPTRRR